MATIEHATPVEGICTHTIPTTIAPKLPSPQICPTCMITAQIRAIESVQEHFDVRGGLFQSKEGGIIGRAGQGHKTVKRAWRTAKIALTNTVEKFEDLLKDKNTPAQDLARLQEALDMWDKKKILLSRVPGLRYVDGAEEGEPTEEEKEGARLLMVWLRMVVEKEMGMVVTKETTLAEAEAEVEARQSSSSSFTRGRDRPRLMFTLPKPTPTDPSVETSRPVSSQKNLISSQSAFQGISAPEPAPEESLEAHQSEGALPATVETTATPLARTRHGVAMPRSILKRPRTSTMPGSQSASPLLKRVRTADSVSISPEHAYIVNPSAFQQLSRTVILLPHAAHTLAENHRKRPEFHRTASGYVPGAWASEAFSEKADTSFRSMTRQEMEERVREESAEQEKEQRLADSLKDISRGWVALWWANKIAPHLDLERLETEMLARSEETDVR